MKHDQFAQTVLPRIRRILSDVATEKPGLWIDREEDLYGRFPFFRTAIARSLISAEDVTNSFIARNKLRETGVQRFPAQLDATPGFAGSERRSELHSETLNAVASVTAMSEGLLSVRAGKSIEQMLLIPKISAALENGDETLVIAHAQSIAQLEAIPWDIMVQALQLYGGSDGTIGHFRHNAADPETFTGHGAFLRFLGDNEYRMDHVSEDRVRYGKRQKSVMLNGIDEVHGYLGFLQDKHWYSAFIAPVARSLGIKDMPYLDDSSFVSWKQRALVDDI